MERKRYHFPTVDLIECVEARPCLWNRRNEDYRDRRTKMQAWREICAVLDHNFQNVDDREQKQIVIEKWRHIRDSFTKSVKRLSTQEKKRKYVYYDNLLFLLGDLEKEEKDDSLVTSNETYELENMIKREQTEYEETESNESQEIGSTVNYSEKIARKSKSENDYEEEKSEPAPSSAWLTPDEDEYFFLSILPSVRQFSQEEKLQFRVEVLQIIQKIRKK